MKKFLFFAAFAAAMFTGCSKDNEIESADASVLGEIGFRAYTSKGETKAGATISDENFGNFKVFGIWENGSSYEAYINGQIVEKKWPAATWDYTPHRFWPAGGDVDFYAYSPATSAFAAFTAGTTSAKAHKLSYTVPVKFNQQEDLLVSKNETATAGTAVDMKFDHALSQFVFEARGNYNELDYTVEKIELINIFSTAVYDYNPAPLAFEWGTYTGTQSYTVIDEESPVHVAYHATDFTKITSDAANTALMVIPGAWEGSVDPGSATVTTTPAATWGYIAITFSIKDAFGLDYNKNTPIWYIPIKVTPELNKRYVYQLVFGNALEPLTFTAEVNDLDADVVVPVVAP